MAFGVRGAVVALLLLVSPVPAAAHTPDWLSHLLEWILGRTPSVGEAPSAGWMTPAPVPPFRLVDQDGQPVTLEAFRRKVVLLSFMRVGCADDCASLTELRALAKALGGKMGRDVWMVAISLDSERDTPEALRAFARERALGFGWKLLTGAPEDVERLAAACGVYVRRLEAGAPGTGRVVEYGDVVLLLDREGRLRKRVLPRVLQLSGRADVEWLLEEGNH